MTITKVDFSMGGDGMTALYKDGIKIKEGDYYHDKIDQFIEGFIFALNTLNIPHHYNVIDAVKENKVAWSIYEEGAPIPNDLQEFDKPSI